MRCSLALVPLVVALGCRGERGSGAASASASAAPAPSESAAPPARSPRSRSHAGQRLAIPAGAFSAGSLPGAPDRQPALEPRRALVELGGFEIDALPFPNEPGRPPRTGVSRAEAARLCVEQGARLCTELEWERACAGPDQDPYAGGSGWDARCATEPESCASGFEVLALGGALREWTASDVRSETEERGAAVRGAGASEPPGRHRCAARSVLAETASAAELGFRCCRGAPNAAVVTEPKQQPVFRKVSLPATELTALLARDPHTQELAKDVVYFREPEAAQTVVSRGPGDKKGFDFTVAPLAWSPAPGVELLVLAARSGKSTSFVLVYWILGEGDYLLEASTAMKDEPGPVALAYSASIRPRLHFSTCWGCPGETGKVLYRPPETIVISQP